MDSHATALGPSHRGQRDRDRLALALDALLENAIAHTGPADRIDVSTRCEDGHVVLAVADTGSGIPAGDLERIFHRFARAEPRQSREAGGFGLGLAIVQAIAEAHHGSVQVHSTPGHGAVFEMLLPVTPASLPLSQPEPRTREKVRSPAPNGGIPAGTPALDPGSQPAAR